MLRMQGGRLEGQRYNGGWPWKLSSVLRDSHGPGGHRGEGRQECVGSPRELRDRTMGSSPHVLSATGGCEQKASCGLSIHSSPISMFHPLPGTGASLVCEWSPRHPAAKPFVFHGQLGRPPLSSWILPGIYLMSALTLASNTKQTGQRLLIEVIKKIHFHWHGAFANKWNRQNISHLPSEKDGLL